MIDSLDRLQARSPYSTRVAGGYPYIIEIIRLPFQNVSIEIGNLNIFLDAVKCAGKSTKEVFCLNPIFHSVSNTKGHWPNMVVNCSNKTVYIMKNDISYKIRNEFRRHQMNP